MSLYTFSSLRRTTAPSALAVSVARAKAHSRIDVSDEDALIQMYLEAAIRMLEEECSRAFITQGWTMKLDRFPSCAEPIIVPRPPMLTVASLRYIDTAGAEQTLTDYQLDIASEPGRILPAYGASWPSTREVPGAVTLVYTAGYGTDPDVSVPHNIRAAILLMFGHLYEIREPVNVGSIVTAIPRSIDALLFNERLHQV